MEQQGLIMPASFSCSQNLISLSCASYLINILMPGIYAVMYCVRCGCGEAVNWINRIYQYIRLCQDPSNG